MRRQPIKKIARIFREKIFVVKYGGAAMIEMNPRLSIMQSIAFLHAQGIRVVVVHGGGPEISAMCKRLQIPTQFLNGQRVTNADTLEIVKMVLLGKTNSALVTTLNLCGVKAVGISGHDATCLQVKKLETPDNADLGFVGDVNKVDAKLIHVLLNENFIPVIAPMGVDKEGRSYNINADIAAGEIAAELNAEKLILLSDVNGFYLDAKNPYTRLSSIKKDTIRNWLQQKRISDGMIPKLQACLRALDQGVSCAHIVDGTKPNSLLSVLSRDQEMGTVITY